MYIVSAGRGGEGKGWAWPKTHGYPKQGGPIKAGLAEEWRWVCAGWGSVRHAENSRLDYTLCTMQISWKQWKRSYKKKMLSFKSFKVSTCNFIPKLKARDISEPLLHRWNVNKEVIACVPFKYMHVGVWVCKSPLAFINWDGIFRQWCQY